jgi:asparagine synthase (glutamine-hydrolysing)
MWSSPEGRVMLGNARLAIQDLSAAGHMPMSDPSGQIWITFNGEVYNFSALGEELSRRGHSFRSRSDTEVILAAFVEWGTGCLAHLNGMFAFAIYDGRLDAPGGPRLFLVRDRAGEKPLYYWHHSGGLSFASELKALMAEGRMRRRLNIPALNAYLALGFVPGQMCILDGLNKLPPAHALLYEVATSRIKTWQYWSPPEVECSAKQDTEALVDELEQLLLESIRLRLVADVPVGILLSGGIDSSLVTAMAARCSTVPVKTFTIVFPGHKTYDEGPYARRVADWFSTDHHELVAEPDTVDLLPKLAAVYDEPLNDSSMVPTYLVSRLARQNVTVALSGDGADELFGGYRRYNSLLRQKALLAAVPRLIRAPLANQALRLLPVGFRGRGFLSSLAEGLALRTVKQRLQFDALSRQNLLATPIRQSLDGQFSWPEGYMLALWGTQGGPVDQITRMEFATRLPEDILVKVDRASMAHSLEVRAPWLDQHIIEFAFGRVPGSLKAGLKERKILPRRLAQRLLPPDLDLNRKQGFGIPLDSWFKGGWGDFAGEVLTEADPCLFNRRAILGLLNSQGIGFSNQSRLFGLTMFELWRRHFGVSF